MRRAIVIQDANGHQNVIEHNDDTVRLLLDFLVKANSVNTILDAEPPDDLRTKSGAEIEEWIHNNCCLGRSGGNFIDIVDVKSDFEHISYD